MKRFLGLLCMSFLISCGSNDNNSGAKRCGNYLCDDENAPTGDIAIKIGFPRSSSGINRLNAGVYNKSTRCPNLRSQSWKANPKEFGGALREFNNPILNSAAANLTELRIPQMQEGTYTVYVRLFKDLDETTSELIAEGCFYNYEVKGQVGNISCVLDSVIYTENNDENLENCYQEAEASKCCN